MTQAELVERLTDLVKQQADIIKELADAMAQLGAVADLDERLAAAAKARKEIIGE